MRTKVGVCTERGCPCGVQQKGLHVDRCQAWHAMPLSGWQRAYTMHTKHQAHTALYRKWHTIEARRMVMCAQHMSERDS